MANNKPSNIPAVKQLLENNQQALQEALPKHLPVTKLIRVMVTQMSLNPKLQECTQASLVGSLLESCLYGLEPDGRDAALVPFYNGKKKTMEAKFISMYQGDLKLARRTGEVALVYAEVVRENDKFNIQKGMNPDLVHVPSLKDAGATIGAYAVIKLKSGEADFVWMTREEIEKIRNSSKAKGASPWSDWWDEMAKKTVLKRMLKQAPKASEIVNDSGMADTVFKAMDALPLPTAEEEAENSIAAPERASESKPAITSPEAAAASVEQGKEPAAPVEKVDTETGEVTEVAAGDVPFPEM